MALELMTPLLLLSSTVIEHEQKKQQHKNATLLTIDLPAAALLSILYSLFFSVWGLFNFHRFDQLPGCPYIGVSVVLPHKSFYFLQTL